jgi:hypothetical protein
MSSCDRNRFLGGKARWERGKGKFGRPVGQWSRSHVHGDVSGNGAAIIDGSGTVDFGAASSANVVFGSGAAGTLKLEDSFHFSGTISGFNGDDAIDLTDVTSATAVIAYHENAQGTGGVLTVSDGTHAAQLSFLGQYSAANFDIVPDPVHGTVINLHHDLSV